MTQSMKVYAIWNQNKKAYYTTGHGCASGVYLVNFPTKEEAQGFIKRLSGEKDYKIKGISVGG